MQRAIKNATYGNNAMVKEVKISRIVPEHENEHNITHLHPQPIHSIDREIHNNEPEIVKTSHNKNNMLNFNKLFDVNKLLEFAKSDDFIILAIIGLLIIEGTVDIILLLALGYLLISDKL
jgi:hypothetical protein